MHLNNALDGRGFFAQLFKISYLGTMELIIVWKLISQPDQFLKPSLYLLLAALGLHCCRGAFRVAVSRGSSSRDLLTVAASLAVERAPGTRALDHLVARGLFLDPQSNPRPLHEQADA